MFANMLKKVFTAITKRKIVDDVVQGINVGGVLAFITVAFLIKNSRNVI